MNQEREIVARWIARLDRVAAICRDPFGAQPGPVLRQAEQAIRACPSALFAWVAPVATPEALAAQHAAQAHVSVALGLCSVHVSCLLSRSAAGHAMATLALPGLEQEASLVAGDLSLAIGGALVRLLSQSFASDADIVATAQPGPFSRLRPGLPS